MARWRLTEKHYLKVPGTRWEFQTVDRQTGRPQRKIYEVPLYLDPEAEMDWNWRDPNGFDGGIIVCHEGKGESRDIVFVGDPTPGMLPIDDEAKALSAQFSWTPTQGTDEESQANSYTSKIMMGLVDQMADMQAKASQAPAIPGMDKFMEVMVQMMAQQTTILAALAGKAVVPAPEIAIDDAEQVIDDEPELPEADEPTAEEIAESARLAAEASRASEAAAASALARRSARRA